MIIFDKTNNFESYYLHKKSDSMKKFMIQKYKKYVILFE